MLGNEVQLNLQAKYLACVAKYSIVILITGGPDVVFDFDDNVMSSADKTMYENTLNIALNRTCIILYIFCFPKLNDKSNKCNLLDNNYFLYY